MSKSDIHDIWFDYAAAFVQQKNASDWNTLATHEQEIAALWLLEADVYNGGFVQFFLQWGGRGIYPRGTGITSHRGVTCA
ncbi:DMP19 family protein [Paenibacillus sp. IITD108]|uniref:DMP19 family protein n=1 Tax=Paenibacillus sp. IITD108 TaxID=3116649 RepID=UPI002F42EF5B